MKRTTLLLMVGMAAVAVLPAVAVPLAVTLPPTVAGISTPLAISILVAAGSELLAASPLKSNSWWQLAVQVFKAIKLAAR